MTELVEILDVLSNIPENDDIDKDLTDVVLEEENKIDEKNIPEHKDPLDVLFYRTPYNRIRRAKIIMFGSVLSPYKKFNSMEKDQKTKLLKQLERACYNRTIDIANEQNIIASWSDDLFCDIYHIICYKISANLEPNGLVGNPSLAKNILDEVINIKSLPSMSSVEMYPQLYTKVKERIEASKNAKQTVKYTTMYKCRRCKKNKCTFESIQNRSLDECNNFVVTCVNCGNEFNA